MLTIVLPHFVLNITLCFPFAATCEVSSFALFKKKLIQQPK